MAGYGASDVQYGSGQVRVPGPLRHEDVASVGRLRGLLIDLVQNQDHLRKELDDLEGALYSVTKDLGGGSPDTAMDDCTVPGDSDLSRSVCDVLQRTVEMQEMVRRMRNQLDI